MAEDKKWEPKPGEGYANPSKNKTEEWHDDFSGQMMLPNGQMHWFSVKDGVGKSGLPWRRVRVGNPVEARQDTPPPAHTPVAESFEEMSDDIPF